ncbi:MAG: type I DNA topoisomerase, partial [Bacteroidota bacterium]
MGVDVKNDFKPKYVTVKGKSPIIKKLKKLSKESSEVLLATDPDREGEAIAWHIASEVKPDNKNIRRVLFNEITQSGIKKGLAEIREIDENLFMSQQARRVMDRLIGYQVSPFLSRAMINKTSESLSAGRVQSVALRLICERESEIQSFVPIDYWTILGKFETTDNNVLSARLYSIDGKTLNTPDGSAKSQNPEEQARIDDKLASLNYINNEERANNLCKDISKESYSVFDIIKKQVKRNPYPPFTTSSLQQEASKRLGFPNNKTMMVAQRLYEGVQIGKEIVGLITYMRTDSVRISEDAQKAARKHIKKEYGEDFLPPVSPQYTSKSKNVQDAHEAIRPTTLDFTPKKVKEYLDKDQANLYELIYNNFLASQMAPALLDQTTVEIKGGNFVFRATGSIVVFKGFQIIFDEIKETNGDEKNGNQEYESTIPKEIKTKDELNLNNVESNKSQTKPKPRFTQASLVKELDELGIGRPSTYATIVSTLTDRKYVELLKKSFTPTQLGVDVNEILVKHFPDIFNVKFTAEMEQDLDFVAEGEQTYLGMMNHFYEPFHKSLHKAEHQGDLPVIACELCGSEMIIRVSRRGRFLGCSNYPECKNTKPLPKDNKPEKAEPQIAEGIVCDICGKPMYIRESKFGKFYGCIDYPTCKGTKPFTTGLKCPKCKEGIIIERFSPKSKKKFYGCSRYPDCDFISNQELVNQKCSACGNEYLEARFKKVEEEWF